MIRFIIRRVLLSLFTLALLIVAVFLLTQVFPSDPARQLAGPFASQERVDELNEQLGLKDPALTQLGRMFTSVFTLDFGETPGGTPISERLWPALGNSAKLVGLALILTLPISIFSGLLAAYRKDSLIDRSIVTMGLATASIPDFVSGVLLQYLLGTQLGWFPAVSNIPRGTGFFGSLEYAVLPALAILLVYFGYIARVTRAGATESFESEYVRTAYMKGLSTPQVVRKHVLRNSLQPTVAVTGTQIGFMFGGLVALEQIYNYPGLGRLIFDAATAPDLRSLQAGVLTVAIIYMLASLLSDLLIVWMNPRARLGGDS
jgi:peptide/nickel transport system permease protein